MERVITINSWWDGPVEGLAFFNNNVCIYERIFDKEKDEYIDEYYLTPINDDEKSEIMKDWNEWCIAVSNGNLDSYYEKNLNNNLIDKILIKSSSRRKFRKKALFSGKFEDGFVLVDYNVEWYD